MNKIGLKGLLLVVLLCLSVDAHCFKALVFSKTSAFRHGSIPVGIAAIKQLGLDHNFLVDVTEDASLFTLDNLKQYGVVIFLSTTGDVLSATQQQEFEKYIQQGGGYVGIHAASDTEYDWLWYGSLVGAYFSNHPPGQIKATIEVADKVHPSTNFLSDYWMRTDEWYNFSKNPRGSVHVLATLDEATYSGGTMGYDHPISWCHEYDGGRAWYTALGHTDESYSEPDFLKHILGGILYASASVVGDYEATVNGKFSVSIIDSNPVNPVKLAVLPDLSVLYIEREGKLKLKDIATGLIKTVATLSVDAGREDGLIGLVLDPDFKTNNWIYLFYSPVGVTQQRVSRFSLVNKTLDLSSEKILLTIPTQRDQCCHSGGDLEFDGNGNLYIALGDNVNPFQSDGFAPIDERPGKSAFDSQGTSGNTKDLRGKILRIHPESDGTYTIPTGNLFTNANDGRPEIFAMGCRNPYRLAIHKSKNELVWGEVGPDAQNNVAGRGPKGYDEFNRTTTSGNFGWPYIIGNNIPYEDYNFATNSSAGSFVPGNLINNSPNNTGIVNIPPAIPAWISYTYDFIASRPEFGEGGRTAMAGDYYKYNMNNSFATIL
jgi:cytochrome c